MEDGPPDIATLGTLTPHGGVASDVDSHAVPTSLTDGQGILRVQYQRVRFDPAKVLSPLCSLLREGCR